MRQRTNLSMLPSLLLLALTWGLALPAPGWAQTTRPAGRAAGPDRVYVPYEKLKDVFQGERQGVFLPYADFQRLWQAAQGSPAGPQGEPVPFLVSTARFSGKVDAELASLHLELTIDVLTDDWVQVPLGLGEVAVVKATFDGRPKFPAVGATTQMDVVESPRLGSASNVPYGTAYSTTYSGTVSGPESQYVSVRSTTQPAEIDSRNAPLLRVIDGQYVLVAKGRGRRVLQLDLVRQLVTKPGQNLLILKTPSAAVTSLELLIPEENMKVNVAPMLAASTTQVTQDGKKATKLQAFLGTGGSVELTWTPTTQAAEDLEPVVIDEQLQTIQVAEALVSYDVTINYDIRRRGVDKFRIQLPGDFRVTAVDGTNINKWDVSADAANGKNPPQMLAVQLFSPAKDKYSLTIKMERFLQESAAQIPLTPIVTQQALRRTGLIAISHSPRRSVELRDAKNLARVDVGRLENLPEAFRSALNPQNPSAAAQGQAPAGQPAGAVVAYRFISADYGGTLAIDVVEPRISVQQLWSLAVDSDALELHGDLNYSIERVGVFQLTMNLPDSPIAWEVTSVGPPEVVDSFQLVGKGSEKAGRQLNILLKRELTGGVAISLKARASRAAPDAPVDFALPLPDAKNLWLHSGQVVLMLAGQLRAEVDQLRQLDSLSLSQAAGRPAIRTLAPAMAYEFQAIDRAKPAGARFKIAVKPAQVSAVVHRLVNIQPGSIEQEAVIDYRILYAPVDTLYVTAPADLDLELIGANIKEKPRLDALPADAAGATPPATQPADNPAVKWVYYKVVLQSPVSGNYQLIARSRRTFQGGQPVTVEPILAAGKLSDQNGQIAVAKADTLAIGEPVVKNLVSGDPGSPADLPYEPHRRVAALAFKYNAPPFELTLRVMTGKEAEVITVLASAAVIEQVLARDRTMNAHATFVLSASRGDRLPVALPRGAKLYSAAIDGKDVQVEPGASEDERIVRLPPSAGQVSRITLELAYGMTGASPGSLTAPALPKDVPVQQTLWRVWIPREDRLLHFDPDFALADADRTIADLGGGAGNRPLAFRLTGQGRSWTFLRQGPPQKLTLVIVPGEAFSIALWAVLIAAGLVLLKLSGRARGGLVLLLLLAAFTAHLFAPLLVGQVLLAAWPAAVVVAGLWLVQWIFSRSRRASATRRTTP